MITDDEERFINGYHIEIPDDGNSMHNLRMRLDDDAIIRVDEKEVDYEQIGSFLSFDVEGLSHDIMVYKKTVNKMPYYVAGSVLTAGVLIFMLIRHHYKKEKPDA